MVSNFSQPTRPVRRFGAHGPIEPNWVVIGAFHFSGFKDRPMKRERHKDWLRVRVKLTYDSELLSDKEPRPALGL
jgi:hypothetical protein